MQLQLPPALAGDEKSFELIDMLLAHTENPFSRTQFSPGHITATGLVLERGTNRVAMVHHRRLNRWLLPGGHVESGDRSIEAAAAREVQEETGLRVSGGRIVGADVHGIPPKRRDGLIVEPYHQHHDVLVAFSAESQELLLSEESHAVRWVAREDFAAFAVPANIERAYARALRRDSQY